PASFEFLQAVRLLEMLARPADPDVEPAPLGDVVRFRASFDLSFAPSEVRGLRRPATGGRPAGQTGPFCAAGGAVAPPPTSFTEEILERLRQHDTAVAAFFDIFHHRLMSLLYRIHKVHRFSLVSVPPERTPFARYMLSLAGVGLPSLA